ncbi:hypothetical protein VYU27_002010 [Nannochloropsis oceanica]
MPPKKKESEEDVDRLTRIAIVNKDKCKPKKCRQECKRNCPVVRQGKLCIEVAPTSKIAFISEELCIGCGICVKKCPFEAINIINLPKSLEGSQTHRYGPNSFKLHRLPMPRPGQILGLVGQNGTGKSTALKILAGKLKPNLGRFDNPPDWTEILAHFRGSELQNYFSRILENNLKALVKPQYVDHIPKAVKGKVGELIRTKDQRERAEPILAEMELNHLLERSVDALSGGELQRFTIGIVCVQQADVYMFDEPSSYLDVKQRLRAALTIRSLVATGQGGSAQTYVLVVEHDLAVLDYLSDYICCLYGTPSAYGVVTMPFSVREGINIFLAGFVPTENLRFRDEALVFKISQNSEELGSSSSSRVQQYRYPSMTRTMIPKPNPAAGGGDEVALRPGQIDRRKFTLHVEAGTFTDSEIVVMLGENGTGKTTFVRMLAGALKSDEEEAALERGDEEEAELLGVPSLNVSYKPQKISPKFPGTVRELLHAKIREAYSHPQFVSDVMRPLNMEEIMDNVVQNLSGGELQRVAIVLCLGKPADVYLIDEPSAYLDSEQRIACSKVIKRFIMHSKKTAFVVEHDFIMATYLADRVIVYEGNPGVEATANAPQSLLTGMNTFLKQLEITFRRDPTNFRPRINKLDSVKDREQKQAGTFFFADMDD